MNEVYELSKDYLRRLLESSGVKLGTAKQAAMVAIIELIDENALGGLIDSIKKDYQEMLVITKRASEIKINYEKLVEKEGAAYRSCERLDKEINNRRRTIDELDAAIKKAEVELSVAGCMDADRSRVKAYKACIDMGMEVVGWPRTSRDVTRVLYAASNAVAGNMVCFDAQEKHETGGEHDEN